MGDAERQRAPAAPLVFAVIFPHFVRSGWIAALMRRVADEMPASASWFNREQLQEDVRETTLRDSGLATYSAATTLVVLFVGIRCGGRGAVAAAALTLAVLANLACVIGVAHRIVQALGVDESPYNLLVAPIVLGNGCDSVLVMLAARDRGHHRWAVQSCLSIVASQVSTMASFCGPRLRVAHFANFFVFAVVTLLSCAMQITPSRRSSRCARAASPRAPPPPSPARGGASPQRSALALAGGVALALAWRPVRLSFEVTTNLHSATPTHRFFRDVIDTNRTKEHGDASFVLALPRGGRERAWQRIEALPALLPQQPSLPMLNWHAAYNRSGMANVTDWWANPLNRMMYEATVNGSRSVVTYVSPYPTRGDARADYDALRALHALDTDDVCLASFERLGGYTIVQTYSYLWVLIGASALFSTLLGVYISGWRHDLAARARRRVRHGLRRPRRRRHPRPPHGARGAHGVPGIVIDYTLRLSYSTDTLPAVLFVRDERRQLRAVHVLDDRRRARLRGRRHRHGRRAWVRAARRGRPRRRALRADRARARQGVKVRRKRKRKTSCCRGRRLGGARDHPHPHTALRRTRTGRHTSWCQRGGRSPQRVRIPRRQRTELAVAITVLGRGVISFMACHHRDVQCDAQVWKHRNRMMPSLWVSASRSTGRATGARPADGDLVAALALP